MFIGRSQKEHAALFYRKYRQMVGQYNNPGEKRQEEIDILAYRKDSAMFCECKWTNACVDIDMLTALTDKTRIFNYKNIWRWLFAKTGFTERLIAEAEKHNDVRLIRYEEMV